MKVLITGISGFVGANLAARLIDMGHEVHGIIRKESKNAWRLDSIRTRITLHEGDILDKDQIQKIITAVKPETLYHLAVYGAYPHQKDPEIILQSSVMATLHLLQAAKEAGVKMFVNTGSSSEYGKKDHAMREDDIVVPNHYYAVGKASQTLLCQNFSHQEGMPIVTVRLFSVYGPYEEPGRLIPTLIMNALLKKDIPLAAPQSARDFIYVDDAVDGLILAGSRPDLAGEIFNIGSGHQETLESVVTAITKAIDSPSRLLWNTYPARPFDTGIWVADMEKSKRILGFKVQHQFSAGILKTIEWIKNNQKPYEK